MGSLPPLRDCGIQSSHQTDTLELDTKLTISMSETYTPFPTNLVEELDELTYRRHRHQTNQSVSFTNNDDLRIRAIVTELWRFPKPRAGDIVAGAELREVVGKGSFGTVWKSYHPESQDWRAVKIFDSDRLGDGLAVHLFRRGVRAMLHLRDELQLEYSQGPVDPAIASGIVQIREVESNRLAFAMDLIPGHDLSFGYSHGRSLEQKLDLFRHIAKTIQFAHTRKEAIVHRDIKPQNIVMNGNIPVLTDFDIADMASARTLSRRAVGGALAYAAPEQLLEETQTLEFRSDIYSLGRLLHYLLLEKEPPLLIEKTPVLSDLNVYPEGLVKIIRKCTYRELQPRYSSVKELLHDLERYTESEDVGAYGPDPVTAHKHWQQASQRAQQGSYMEAIHSGEQALKYLETSNLSQQEEWNSQLLWWRFRNGSYRLFFPLLTGWLNRHKTLLLTVIMMGLFVTSSFLWTRPTTSTVDPTFEQKIIQLLEDRSEKLVGFHTAVSYMQQDPKRKKKAQTRLAQLLFEVRGRQACLVFKGLFLLSKRVFRTQVGTLHLTFRSMDPLLPKVNTHRKRNILAVNCPPGSVFHGLKVSHIRISKASLPRVDFSYTDWHRPVLRYNDMQHSKLMMTKLIRSNFEHNNVKFGQLDYVQMDRSTLAGTNLFGASLRFASLRGARLDQAVFTLTDLRDAKLEKADTRNASFYGAIMRSTTLQHINNNRLLRKNAVCFTQSYYEPSLADQCFRWHRKHHYLLKPLMLHRWVHENHPETTRPPMTPPPPGCPQRLRSVILTFPLGQLKQEGQCPWQKKPLAPIAKPTSRKTKASSTSTKPSSRPSRR